MLNTQPKVRITKLNLLLLKTVLLIIFLNGGHLSAYDGDTEFSDILAHQGLPESVTDWSFAPFSDQGAWFGFALPPEQRPELHGGFSGPFLFSSGRWVAPQLLSFTLRDTDTGQPVELSSARDHSFTSLPGMLRETMTVDGLAIEQTLWFERTDKLQAGMAVIRLSIQNMSEKQKSISIDWAGSIFKDEQSLESNDQNLLVNGDSGYTLRLNFGADNGKLSVDEHSYLVSGVEPHLISPGASVTSSVIIDLSLKGDPQIPDAIINTMLQNTEQSFALNRERWDQWLKAVSPDQSGRETEQVIAIKSLQTLVNNWRGPAGRLSHHGMFPSHNVWYFNGYWAWDTWKQAVGVLIFDAELAKALVRGMFEHQDSNGMVPDVVYLDSSEDNWRDSKPPLAAWAVDAIYQATGDLEFVRELYPKLTAYHAFWYRDRDHNRNGLCEYGSTDGSLEAARWESGMDNAVRFDHSKMVQNSATAWSMDQESVDLNSYLLVEKQALMRMAKALGLDDETWRLQAGELQVRIGETFYDETDGWFYDVSLEDGSFIRTQSPEGWIPLWAGAASAQQAVRVRDAIMDKHKFRTFVPFPTVAADDAKFSDGYWRGLVWLDQAYFAIEGLRRYGFDAEANDLTRQLFSNLKGVSEAGVPIHENYHPLTGEVQNVRHFSWSAAHLLMLTRKTR